MRTVANVVHQQGNWGSQHAIRMCTWAEHLKRPRNSESLAALLYKHKDAKWLENRRLDPDTGGPNRPGTRSHSGFFHSRWDEALVKAKNKLLQRT